MFQRFLQSKICTGLILIIIGFLGLSLLRRIEPLSTVEKERAHLEQKVSEAKAKNQRLAQEEDYLKNQAYLERQARIKLNYKKADETAVLIYETRPASPSQSLEPTGGFWQNIVSWLRKLF